MINLLDQLDERIKALGADWPKYTVVGSFVLYAVGYLVLAVFMIQFVMRQSFLLHDLLLAERLPRDPAWLRSLFFDDRLGLLEVLAIEPIIPALFDPSGRARLPPWENQTSEWTEVQVQQGDARPRNLSQCNGANCAQPALSGDGSKVVFVRIEP